MAFRCTTFILRVSLEEVPATIRMHSNDEVVEVAAGQTDAGGRILSVPEWGARFYYTLGRPRTEGIRPNPIGRGTIANRFTIEWTPPMFFPRVSIPYPASVSFGPEAPAGDRSTGPRDELEGELGGEAPIFPLGIVGTFDYIGRICFFQPDPPT